MSTMPNIEKSEMFARDKSLLKALRLFGYAFFITVLMVTAFRAGSLYQQVAVFHEAQMASGTVNW
jgi:hypothetical protein